jgi:sugar phosphate isomerase/epimerase
VCCGAENAELAKAAGCDYIEMNFTTIARQDDEVFDETLEELARVGIACEAMNCFIPADFALAQPELDMNALGTYLEQGFARAKQLGVQVVVFGSARARRLPDNTPKQTGWELLAPVYRVAGDAAVKVGVTIAIEPLHPGECNAVHTLRDGLALMNLVAHPNVRLLADMFHMAKNGEDMQDILLAGADLQHCHIASPQARLYPMPGDGCDYTPFLSALREIGYAGRLSIEAGAPNSPEQDLAASVTLLRELA